ncbi:MAG: translation elongation factor-like protein [Dehalococcoidia bacterium]
MPEEEVGTVSKFFAKPMVAGIDLSASVKLGDKLHIKGHTTDMQFVIGSMQIDNANVEEGKQGDSIGIKVTDRAREGDKVYRITD